MPKEVKEDLREFQTTFRLPNTEGQQQSSRPAALAGGPKLTATPAAEAQHADKASDKPSPTAAESMPSTSQSAPAKPPKVHPLGWLSEQKDYILTAAHL